ncbi:Soluble lytic murein transglycosylase precursor [hydrothermal vent metagenome]|uniref:Soluble lytic murein transglycosylase n=1 Tax=hydrothermal vent metagenome TaxID=652676 RepID=A0A3B0VZD9_9ZZZZ
MNKIFLHLCWLLLAVDAYALTAQQTLFKQVYAKALQGDVTAVVNGKKQLHGYRLNHYLDFALIKANMPKLPEAEIIAFKQKNADSPLNASLNQMLIYELGKQQKWVKYLQKYKNNRDSQTRHCWYLQARIATKDFKGLPQAITDTWMNGLSLPDACNSVFSWWEQQEHLNDKLLAKRIKLSFQVNNASTARFLANKMTTQPIWVKHALMLMQEPIKTLKKSVHWQDNHHNRELIYIKSKALAQKQPNTMYNLWAGLKKHFSFTGKQQAQVDRTIALFAATDYLPFTITAMNALPAAQHDAQIYAWKVRYYLFTKNWKLVTKTIKAMPDFQRNKDSWQYWLARARAKTGNQQQAKKIFSKLALKTNYYGFLAADHMHLPYQICNEDIAATMIVKLPENLENAFELFALGMIKQARREWTIGYRQLNTGQRRALADLAYQKGWYNKVSAIMAGLGLWQNYKLRYPLAYKQEITKLANQYQLLPQWIMSIITQESAWQTDAISRADARGLMQLIDATAARMSKKLGLQYLHKTQLHDANFNLHLGIYYQRLLFDKFNNHPLLALASYNAGETKAKDWLKGFPTAPDIWAETIPYRETRGYITKILTNITIYDWLINQTPRRITSWMPTFPVDGVAMQKWPKQQPTPQTATVTCQQ